MHSNAYVYIMFNRRNSKAPEGFSYAKLHHFGREDFEIVNKVENITDTKDCKYVTRPKEEISYYICLHPVEKDIYVSGV